MKKILFIIFGIINLCFLIALPFGWGLSEEEKEEKAKLKEVKATLEERNSWYDQKKEVSELLHIGENRKVEKLFRKDEKDFLKLAKKEKHKQAKLQEEKLFYVYYRNDYNKDRIEFRKIEYLFQLDDELVVSKGEAFLTKYPNSDFANNVVAFLQKKYSDDSANEDVLRVFKYQKGFATEEQEYLVGQADFNLDNYDAAERRFKQLETSKLFGFKAKQMIALVTAMNGNLDDALIDIQKLLNKDNDDEPTYPVLFLLRARIFSMQNQIEDAIQNYLEYFERETKENIDSSPYYELASLYFEIEEYGNAQKYGQLALEIIDNLEIYKESKFLMAWIEQKLGNIERSNQLFDEAMNQSNYFINLLDKKYNLLQEADSILKTNATTIESDDKVEEFQLARLEKSENIETKLDSINIKINKFKALLGKKEVEKLNTIEADYIKNLNLADDYELKINNLLSTSYKKNSKTLDIIKQYFSENIATQYAYQMLTSKGALVASDYRKAYHYANVKRMLELIEEKASTLKDYAQKQENYQMLDNIELLEDMIANTKKTKELEIKHNFGEIDFKNENQKRFKNNVKLFKQTIVRIENLKTYFETKHNKLLAKEEEKEQQEILARKESLENQYTDLKKEIASSLKEVNTDYEADKLEILFQQTLELQDDFDKKYNNSSNTNNNNKETDKTENNIDDLEKTKNENNE